MKATGIEQIREHLARGGRVLARNDDRNEEWEAIEFNGGYLTLDVNGMRLSCPVDRVKPEGWELLPIEEEKKVGETFRDSQKERMQRIRQSLLFGHYPSLDDLRAWWQATTGERIEWGRRCNHCECSGSFNVYGKTVHCIMCNGSGYTVRPTWMVKEATGDE